MTLVVQNNLEKNLIMESSYFASIPFVVAFTLHLVVPSFVEEAFLDFASTIAALAYHLVVVLVVLEVHPLVHLLFLVIMEHFHVALASLLVLLVFLVIVEHFQVDVAFLLVLLVVLVIVEHFGIASLLVVPFTSILKVYSPFSFMV